VEAVRCTALLFALILLGRGSQLQGQDKKPWSVDRICGRIEYVRKIPVRNATNTFNEKRKPLRGLALDLHNGPEGTTCCDGLKSVATTISGKGGKFDLKQERPGRYWLSTTWNGREYMVAVMYRPQKVSRTLCSQQGIGLDDDGNMDWWETVTVD
jgi:hypothetical protein